MVSTGQGILGNNMFAYCRNNPVCRIDISGTADEEVVDLDGNPIIDEDDIVGGGNIGGGSATNHSNGGGQTGNGGGQSSPTIDAGSPRVSGDIQQYSFKSEQALNNHFDKHNAEFGNQFNTPQEYLNGANDVIQNGQYVSAQNAYVQPYGAGGDKYSFVGMDHTHSYITTFHVRDISRVYFD